MEDKRIIVLYRNDYYPSPDNCLGIFEDLKTASKYCKQHKAENKKTNSDRGTNYKLEPLRKYIQKHTKSFIIIE